MAGLLIVADDLSGAAETAGAVAAAVGSAVEVRLTAGSAPVPPVLAIDTHTRGLAEATAAHALADALRHADDDTFVYKKVDSLLRGNIAAEVAALRAAGFDIAAALAVPRVGRTVHDGVVHVHGAPLHVSGLLEVEHAHRSVAAAIGLETVTIPVRTIRSTELASAVRAALDRGLVPVFDGEVQTDLDAVAAVLASLDRRPAVLAAGGLARSVAPLLSLDAGPARFAPGADRVVVVVGTRAASAAGQVRRLGELGLREIVLRPGEEPGLDGGDTVVTIADDAGWDAASLAEALAAVARAVLDLPGRTDLALTGGDTARRVLDALGVRRLHAELELEPGTVLSTTDDGNAVVTRPGSFGDDDSLARIVSKVRGIPT